MIETVKSIFKYYIAYFIFTSILSFIIAYFFIAPYMGNDKALGLNKENTYILLKSENIKIKDRVFEQRTQNGRKDVLVYSQHPERECMPGGGGQPFAGAFSKDEIRHLRRLSRGSDGPREHSRSW